VTGLYDDDELSAIVSEVISDMAPKLIGDEPIGNRISSFVRFKCNELLSHMTGLELLNMIATL